MVSLHLLQYDIIKILNKADLEQGGFYFYPFQNLFQNMAHSIKPDIVKMISTAHENQLHGRQNTW